LQARLTASYVLVTLTAVLLVAAIVLGYQTPHLVNDAALQPAVVGTASTYAQRLMLRYPDAIVPANAALGDSGEPARPGHAQLAPDGSELAVPAISGTMNYHGAVTAVVVIAPDGTALASSAPSRYPPGQAVISLLPAAAADTITQGRPKNFGTGSTPFGPVSWAMAGLYGSIGASQGDQPVISTVYVQTPQSTEIWSPLEAWNQLRQRSDAGTLLLASYALLIAIVPTGALFGLLASRRLVRRVRRLEKATIAVANGDYGVGIPISGRDEIGSLEENFSTMTKQLGSALTAERQRATHDARAGERTRIAREIHDGITQHLFSLRMIAGGMLRANPGEQQLQTIDRIAEEAIGEMQALLHELRPDSLDSAALVAALEEVCHAYRDRLGVEVDADLDDVALPPAVEHALLRIAQEAFVNAVRHGNARRLALSTTHSDGHVELAVRDTGTGFDPSVPHSGSGLGHMRARVAELGGTVHIASSPGQGAAVIVRIPVS
jgi:signal transduction histidine kinase